MKRPPAACFVRFKLFTLLAALLLGPAAVAAPLSRPLVVDFDFSRSAVALQVQLRGKPALVLLDTGVNPSAVDLATAQALGLPVDRSDPGEASGLGEGKGAQVYSSAIDGLAIGAQAFDRFDALAVDLRTVSSLYGQRLDAVLGFSFLADKTVLIDYPAHRLVLLPSAEEAAAWTRSCGKRWSVALELLEGMPLIPAFRFGEITAPVSLDTGANGGVGLFGAAFEMPALSARLQPQGEVARAGARGEARAKTYRFDGELGFGPFLLPPGQTVTRHAELGVPEQRLANVGNGLLNALGLKVLLDYSGSRLSVFGDCR